VHPTLRARAETRLGVFTTAEALRAGYGHGEIRALCRSGSWVRLRRGVLVSAADLATSDRTGRHFDVECLAVLAGLTRPTALVSHDSAARLWEVPTPRTAVPTIRLTDPLQWRRGQGYLMTCAPVAARERWHAGPVPLTSATRTLVDCAREWTLEDAVVALDAGLLAERTTIDDLERAVAAASHWPGAPRAQRAVALADGRAESPLETRGRLRIVGAGLPTPELQVEIRTAGRLVAVVDAWFDDAAVAVEFDGQVKYTAPWRGRTPERVLWEEKRREDELRSLDIRVVRVVDADLGDHWPVVERRLRGAVSTPGPAPRSFTANPRPRGTARTR
jgi:hypothetical protein